MVNTDENETTPTPSTTDSDKKEVEMEVVKSASDPSTDPTKTKTVTEEGGNAASSSSAAAEIEAETTQQAAPAEAAAAAAVVPPSNTAPVATTATTATTTTPTVGGDADRKMRAVTLTSFGGLKNIKIVEKPLPPAPGDGQVTIEVKVSGVNFQDILLRLGISDVTPSLKTPLVMGTECIGVVTAIGGNVNRIKVNDLVFAFPESGAFSEVILADERCVFKVTKPSLTMEELACTLPYIVAYMLLSRSGVNSGATIVVQSAGGGVGLAIKELAAMRGINVVGIASAGKHDALGKYEFKHLVARGQDYVAEIKKLYPDGVDAVFDSQGGDDISRGISLLAPLGTYILFGTGNIVTGENRGIFTVAKGWWTQVEKIPPMKLLEENKLVGGFRLRSLLKACPERVQKTCEDVWELMTKKEIHPVVDKTFHFEQMATAMQRMHERKNVGKILIRPDIEVPAPPDAAPATPAVVPVEQGTLATEEASSSTSTSTSTTVIAAPAAAN